MNGASVSVGAWEAFAVLAGPVLIAMLVIGLVTGMLQTATQIREPSIPFVLKLSGVAVLSTLAGQLMMGGVEHFAAELFAAIPGLIRG